MEKQIAIYGKGGIGKSTLSANISASLGKMGVKTLQIGCDPKHDSTRLLMNGKRITTVLDYIRDTNPLDYRLDEILFDGYNNVGCIEAGGPKPGVGCAGRGVISVFELLEKFHVKSNYDMVVYDVLGDVVCGGFAVPIRKEYADTIFLVTSGEYMAIYAANNILRGIKNYDHKKCRVAGILYNSRNVKKEDERVQGFAKAVGLPIFAKIPRDDIFATAEREQKTVIELCENETDLIDDSGVKDIFADIAEKIVKNPTLYPAKPLDDEELEFVVMGTVYEKKQAVGKKVDNVILEEQFLSKNVVRDEPLHGCAFNGAINMSIHLKDMAILAHSPKSCAYLSNQTITSGARRHVYERGALLPVSLVPNLISTNMDENDMVFGGNEKMLDTVAKIRDSKNPPKALIVVSSCPAGIIGDDIDKAKELATDDFDIVTIKAEGNLTGDYMQGMLLAYTEIARQIIDTKVQPEDDTVNVVFEKVIARNTEINLQTIKSYLDVMDIKINCRFLCDTTYDELKNFCKAKLNLLAYKDYTGLILCDFFEKNFGSKFYDKQFPVGFLETENWLNGIAAEFDKIKKVQEIIDSNKAIYEKRIAAIKDKLQGKKLMIVTYNHDLDWILQAALDVGMNVVKLCILNFSQDSGFRTSLDAVKDLLIEENYDKNKRLEDIATYKPDIILSNYESSTNYTNAVTDTIPMCPDSGFFSGLVMLERWANLFRMNLDGEWKNDKKLFDEYYSR